ncbi:MAG: hypothetical protein IKY83_03155 [Proteobacteria bacterium]|nr:hypothetical protein [Pseudomonadota bacterium]
MQISDFLQKYLSPKALPYVAFETGIRLHFDAYLQQIWPEGRIVVVSELDYREYAEQKLLPALSAHGFEPVYCLCVRSGGVTPRSQIEEALGDGALEHVVGIISLGSCDLFSVVRGVTSTVNVGAAALLCQFPDAHVLDVCGEDHPCADAVFCDLDEIMRGCHGDCREAIQHLEVDNYAFRADLAVLSSLNRRIPEGVMEALREAQPPRETGAVAEEYLAELCDAYMWRAVAARLFGQPTSFDTVLRYAASGQDFEAYPASWHARLMAQVFDSVLEVEGIEISPEACAGRQPPKDILRRTLQQILLQDGQSFDYLAVADENYEDRNTLRLLLNALVLNWDGFCSHLRSVADMMHVLGGGSEFSEAEDCELDASLKSLWLHASRFAPKCSFLKVLNALGMIEPALYI